MKMAWESPEGEKREVTAPLSLTVTAFGPVDDVTRTWTPELRTDIDDTVLLFVDLAGGKQRLVVLVSLRCSVSSVMRLLTLRTQLSLRPSSRLVTHLSSSAFRSVMRAAWCLPTTTDRMVVLSLRSSKCASLVTVVPRSLSMLSTPSCATPSLHSSTKNSVPSCRSSRAMSRPSPLFSPLLVSLRTTCTSLVASLPLRRRSRSLLDRNLFSRRPCYAPKGLG